MSAPQSSLVPSRPVTLFFISSPRTLSPWPHQRDALLTAIAALPIQIYSRSFMSPPAESFKLSLPRRDTDNSNHAVTDEGGAAAAGRRLVLWPLFHDDDDADDKAT